MDHIEQKICDIIDSKKDEIIAFGRDIWRSAELGYREYETSRKFTEALKAAGVSSFQEKLAVTGVKGYLKGQEAEGPTVALMGEFDGLPIPAHKDANPATGASHCCGHNAQITGVVGAALALNDPEIKAALDGNVVFFGVPAEEYASAETKADLIGKGLIKYSGGKCEMIRIGALDDIDLVIGHHADTHVEIALENGTNNGFVTKHVAFRGRAAHAAGSPHKGIDALAAQALAMHAVDVQRESFKDKDSVRVHSFITHGGEAANIIAAEVTSEYSVRANNIPAIKDASMKVDRALRAAAIATGCEVEIKTETGYLPLVPAKDSSALLEVLNLFKDEYEITLHEKGYHNAGSTDYGDLSSLKAFLQFNTGGYSGSVHTPMLNIEDEYLAYVVTAKIFALSAYNMLKNGGSKAKAIAESFEPALTKEEYFTYMDSMMNTYVEPMNPLPILP